MDSILGLTVTVSDMLTIVALGCCVIFAIIMFLTNENRKLILARISSYSLVYLIPFMIMFAYITAIWVAKILLG